MNEGKERRNPDILETIADLSNDEVFTPPKLANDVLDMLPKELWSDSSVTFLDPTVKTGIFLRAITERLIEGLADEIPDLQERVNHILTKQVFGLGITELTTLMSRRSVYCSTEANGEYSVCTEFTDVEGNIKFPNSKHDFNKDGKCEVCGASKDNYDNIDGLDNYAYSFLHDDVKEVFGDMKFDVIIGNPPYQISVGNEGANASYATAIYDSFVDKALELNPKYISMIIPSRWMSNAAEGVSSEWTKKIIGDKRFKEINDYENANEVFKTVEINGGVNYFLWDSNHDGDCKYTYNYEDGSSITRKLTLKSIDENIIIRDLVAQDILRRVQEKHPKYQLNEKDNFTSLVATYGMGKIFSTSWRGYRNKKTEEDSVKYYVSEATNGVPYGWISESDVNYNPHVIPLHKIFIPRAHGGSVSVLGKPKYGEPGSIPSNTYAIIGTDKIMSKKETINLMNYISTKFFRFMVKILKTTQGATRRVYQFVPLQDWSKEWTDAELYRKYKLTQEEINHIENSISTMDISKELEIANSIPDEQSTNEVDSDDK